MSTGNHASCDGAEQLHVVADRLALDDAPPSQKTAGQTLDEAAAAAEASALPVPLVVAVPILPQFQATKSGPETPPAPTLPGLIEPTTDEERAEREYHLRFMREALDMGDLALKTNETPVGCVLVYKGRIIAKGMNATNITRNGTRHAEFMALSALLSRRESSDIVMTNMNLESDDASWGDVDPKDGHIYPYGQKLHPAPVVDRSIISECVLYVTVEPCVMCASLLRQLGIKKVYFGAVNDKFGGTGGVFRVHMNSKPVPIPKDRPYQQGYGPQDLNLISKGRAVALPRENDEGDGGNVESGYPVEGGYLRDDAVSLLRRFYVQENGRAPQPRKKEGRAARLYAAMENQGKPVNVSDLSDNAPETFVEAEAPLVLDGKPDPVMNDVCD
ncbi:cytidine deaminase-like protein [Xylaria cf. heliscus]|nr:cytidine deaminase-like protein [Xylaria cf. heliscus]